MIAPTWSRVLCALVVWTAVAHARNVDLSTVPTRDTVQLTIYNSEDLTLVRETRTVTFKKGSNPLQFSWAGTLIDPTSVELKFISRPDELEVLDTTFPHDKPQMLYWNVESEFDGEAKIEISYFTSGITWSADYLCIADINEKNVDLEGFVRVYNRSGEEYEDAQIRLVVGTINLVEKIAQLAGELQRSGSGRQLRRDELRLGAIRRTLSEKDQDGKTSPRSREKQVIKEGLSEYFIYTIEGAETIRNGWSKRMRSFEGQTVPMRIAYRYRPRQYGDQLVRVLVITNDKASHLGTTPLPDGVVRVLRENGRDGLSYLGEQRVKYIPIGDKIEINLAADPEVTFELVKRKVFRDEIWLRVNGFNVYRRIEDAAGRVEVNSTVAGWRDHELFSQRIVNHSRKPIDVEVRREFDGDVEFRSRLEPVLHDYRTVQFSRTIKPGEKAELHFEIARRHGHGATQSRVTIQPADVLR